MFFERSIFSKKQQNHSVVFSGRPDLCFFSKKNLLMGHISDLNKKDVGDIFVEISHLLSV